METLEQAFIKARSTPDDFIPLSAVDLLIGNFYTEHVFFFRKYPNIVKLKDSLQVALEHFPAFGGSIIRHKNQFLIYRNNVGAQLKVCKSTQDCPVIGEPITDDSPLLDEGRSIDYMLDRAQPLSYFRVTLFPNDLWTLTGRTVHSLGDGITQNKFLLCWAAAYNNKPLPATNAFSRKRMATMGSAPGYKPSDQLKIFPRPNFDIAEKTRENINTFSSINIEISKAQIDYTVASYREGLSGAISSSDIIHALGWKAYAMTQDFDPDDACTLYTAYDMRRVKGLELPDDYEGYATTQRSASLSFGKLRSVAVPQVAVAYSTQVKPVTKGEMYANIAFLNREYALGNIDTDGHYTGFMLKSSLDSADGSGIQFNDLRFYRANDLAFEEGAIWYECIFNAGKTYVFVYQKNDGAVLLRYTGHRNTLVPFSEHLHSLLSPGHGLRTARNAI
jgi:hypothetical protein